MSRHTALTVGIAITAATVLLLVYAAKRVAYFFSFAPSPRPAAVSPGAGQVPAEPPGEVTLSWDEVPDADHYNLYWSTRPGVTRHTGRKVAGVRPPYRFAGVEKGQTYYFVVTAVSEAGESGESEEIVYRNRP